MKNFEQAMEYLHQGLCVLPVRNINYADGNDPNNKRPALSNWKEYQSRLPTETEIFDWFVEQKYTRMGFVCGEVSNLTVVDIDNKNGEDVYFDKLFSTVESITPTNSRHLWFSYDKNIPAYKQKNLEIRTDGMFVVDAPSEHWTSKPDNLKYYQWVKPFNRAVLNPLDTQMLKMIYTLGGIGTYNGIKKQIKWDKILGKGERNVVMTQIIGSLVHYYPPEDWESIAKPLGWAYACKYCVNIPNDPYTLEQFEATFESIINKEKNSRLNRLTLNNLPPLKKLYELNPGANSSI